METLDNVIIKRDNPPLPATVGPGLAPIRHLSRARIATAFGIAAVSDFLAMWTELIPPVQWVLDLGTAGALFLILGRRWALLPGLLFEAIPGMGVFPVWVLVVLSLVVYDEIKGHKR